MMVKHQSKVKSHIVALILTFGLAGLLTEHCSAQLNKSDTVDLICSCSKKKSEFDFQLSYSIGPADTVINGFGFIPFYSKSKASQDYYHHGYMRLAEGVIYFLDENATDTFLCRDNVPLIQAGKNGNYCVEQKILSTKRIENPLWVYDFWFLDNYFLEQKKLWHRSGSIEVKYKLDRSPLVNEISISHSDPEKLGIAKHLWSSSDLLISKVKFKSEYFGRVKCKVRN